MKITIVTPYDSANYGAYLQALANKIFLEELGHSVFFYKWRSPKKRKQLFFGKKDSIKNLIKYVIKYKYNAHKYHVFSDALNIFHEIDENELSAMELAILGSDEIWNINVNTFQNPVFYGEINVPKICAYAPSAGNGAELERYNSVCCSLAQVEIIGVRDQSTVELVEKLLNKKTKLVVDPTLLIPFSYYPVPNKRIISEKYMLIYSYDISKEHIEWIKRYAHEKKLKTVAVCMQHGWCDKNICVSPLEFLSLIRDAECVYTTTFHGSIFTFLQHKRCYVDIKSTKVKDLLAWTGMTNQVNRANCTYERFIKILDIQPNYNLFEENLLIRRKQSSSMYQEILTKIEKMQESGKRNDLYMS